MGGRDGWVKEWGFDNPNASNKNSSSNVSLNAKSASKLGNFRLQESGEALVPDPNNPLGSSWKEIARESGMIGVIKSVHSSSKAKQKGIKEILRAFLLSKKLRKGYENFGIKSGTFGITSTSGMTNFGSKSSHSQHTSSSATQ